MSLHGTSSPSPKPGGSVPGGHVSGSALFHKDLMFGSFPLSIESDPRNRFKLATLWIGSLVVMMSWILESPRKYVARPEIVAAANTSYVSSLLRLMTSGLPTVPENIAYLAIRL